MMNIDKGNLPFLFLIALRYIHYFLLILREGSSISLHHEEIFPRDTI